MEARLAAELPSGPGWQFEPKWDGFRALAMRNGSDIALYAKSGKSLLRYFPEIGELLLRLPEERFVLDGELILPAGDHLSFDALQQRLHPAASRITKLARETPAQLMVFDCLRTGDRDLTSVALSERRQALEVLVLAADEPSLLLSPSTESTEVALAWLERTGGALDGIMAKRVDEPYQLGERAMVKVKQIRTADCVVGGFRRTKDGSGVASILLGLFNDRGELDHVGFSSSFKAAERGPLLAKLQPLVSAPGFTGKAPSGPSRWRAEAGPWEPLAPKLVVEVKYDQVTAVRFRHGTTFLRWRPDKAPKQCDFTQLMHELRPAELATIMHGK